jgi:PIN domain nuclease of toxin-antitoxin system
VPFVLDASAYLAYVMDEPGADAVERVMVNDEAVMSAINVAEIMYRLAHV